MYGSSIANPARSSASWAIPGMAPVSSPAPMSRRSIPGATCISARTAPTNGCRTDAFRKGSVSKKTHLSGDGYSPATHRIAFQNCAVRGVLPTPFKDSYELAISHHAAFAPGQLRQQRGREERPYIFAAGQIRFFRSEGRERAVQGDGARSEI